MIKMATILIAIRSLLGLAKVGCRVHYLGLVWPVINLGHTSGIGRGYSGYRPGVCGKGGAEPRGPAVKQERAHWLRGETEGRRRLRPLEGCGWGH